MKLAGAEQSKLSESLEKSHDIENPAADLLLLRQPEKPSMVAAAVSSDDRVAQDLASTGPDQKSQMSSAEHSKSLTKQEFDYDIPNQTDWGALDIDLSQAETGNELVAALVQAAAPQEASGGHGIVQNEISDHASVESDDSDPWDLDVSDSGSEVSDGRKL